MILGISGSRWNVNGECKKEEPEFSDNNAGLDDSNMNRDNVLKRTDTIAAPVAPDDIAIDNIKQKKNSKSHNDNKDNNTNHEASSNVDSNGNIVEAIDAKENKKKKSSRTTKQRSKSFHIKCDRKYS